MTELLQIDGTEDTPAVSLDKRNSLFSIRGSSFPENAVEFYGKIISWINEIGASLTNELVCEFYLIYLNSASNKMLYDIFNELEIWYLRGKQISVKWIYDEMDEDMLELGEDFAELVELPFEFEAVEMDDEDEDDFF